MQKNWGGRDRMDVSYKYSMVFGTQESTGIFLFLSLNLQLCMLKVTYISLHTIHQITHYLTNQ